jgi:NAD(P)H dehydrogenase (quinone)
MVLTGATGALGSQIINNLLESLPASTLVACVRDLKQFRAIAARGVEVRHGDFDKPVSLIRAFASADRLLIISASGIDHQRRVAQHRNAIEAAARAKVGHVFYTSLVRGEPSVAYVMKAHADTERILKESGLQYTILQNGIYAEAHDTYLGDYSHGEVLIPADGPMAWTSWPL